MAVYTLEVNLIFREFNFTGFKFALHKFVVLFYFWLEQFWSDQSATILHFNFDIFEILCILSTDKLINFTI